MSQVVRGRFVGTVDGRAVPLEVRRADTGAVVPVDERGGFAIELADPTGGGEAETRAAPVRLQLRRGPGAYTEVLVDPADDGEVVILEPEPAQDPRDVVAAVTDRLTAEREARGQARAAIADEVAGRTADEEAVRGAVDAVLASVAARRGGDTTWRLDPADARDPSALERLTEQAVDEARHVVDTVEPVARIAPGTVSDGERLPSGELVGRILGAPAPAELVHRSALELARRWERARDADGLPAPITPGDPTGDGSAPPPDGGSGAGDLETLIGDKVTRLVDAIRLPEDPPLLLADQAVTGTGADVELARGVADVTAFHDFHELVLALPSVWAEVFDRRFVDLVEESVRELVAAGADVTDLTQPGRAAQADAVLVDRLRGVATTYRETAAAGLRAPSSVARASSADTYRTLLGSEHGLLAARPGDDFDLPSPRPPTIPPPQPPTPLPLPPWGPVGEISDEAVVATDPTQGVPGLLRELESMLRGQHAFTVFPADGARRALNFGVLLSWRQRWEPLSYQTGEIAYTTTLAPGERRKVVTKRARKLKRFTSEAERSQSSRTTSSSDTTRAEAEILRKATATTNFHLTSEGSTKLLVQDGSFTTSATRDVGRQGGETRRRFRESVLKAAQEFRDEHAIEVRTEAEELFEEETTAEIRNPNDEIAVTAVFYALQRRYRVAEHLERARPVVMVAMPVPDRSQITTAWLVRHAWILDRSLLDDRFRAALAYLTTSFLGDTEALTSLRAAVVEQQKALAEAQHRLGQGRRMVEHRSERLSALRRRLAAGDSEGLFDLPGLSLIRDASDFVSGLFGGGDDDAAERERNAMLLAASEDELARAEREAREAETQLVTATNAYQQAVRDYVEAKRTQRNHEVRISELRLHAADNLDHYLKAIWASEPPDQRFFELHTVQVPDLTSDVVVTASPGTDPPGVGGLTPQQFKVRFAPAGGGSLAFRPLVEVADLDQLLGFKGNYAIFPLRAGNALTDVILAPYLDEHEILRDPDDPAATWTLDELRAYADHLRALVAAGTITQQEFDDEHAPFLRAMLERLVTDPRPSESVVIVPTDSLYADLLTSGGSLIEPFKKEHRSLDVAKVRGEIRAAELDNLRRAARIEAGDLADPDMDDFERHLVRRDGAPGG